MPGDFKPVAGHKTTFHCHPVAEFDGIVVVLEADKPHCLSCTWKTSSMINPATVTYILTPTDDGRLPGKGKGAHYQDDINIDD